MMVLESIDLPKDVFSSVYKKSFNRASTLSLVTTTYAERLASAMELAGLKGREARRQLSEMLRDTMEVKLSVQAIGQVLTDPRRAFSAEISARVARLLRVDHYWLATGEGEPRPAGLSDDATAWARRYDRLNTEGRAKFSAAIVLAQTGVPDKVVEQQMPITAQKPGGKTTAKKKTGEKVNHH